MNSIDAKNMPFISDSSSSASFWAAYWHKLCIGPQPHLPRLAPFLSWKDVNDLLSTHMMTGEICRLVKDKRAEPPTRYIDLNTRFVKSKAIKAILRDGGTLVLNNVEAYFPYLRTMALELERLTFAAVHINVYAVWGSFSAFGLHRDPQDSLVVQLEGRKHWTLWKQAVPEGQDMSEVSAANSAFDGVIEPGQWIYMPRGCWHTASGCGEPSLHATVGLTHYSLADIIAWLLEDDATCGQMTLRDISADLNHAKETVLDIVNGNLSAKTLKQFLAQRQAVRCSYPSFNLPAIDEDQT